MRRYLFPAILGLAGVAILLSLGFWQLRRLEWKTAMLAEIQQGIEAPPQALPATPEPGMKYLPVEIAGHTLGPEVLVLGGSRETGGGYLVISAFETDDGRRVMVQRGFIPEGARHAERPPVELRIEGNLHWPQETTSSTPAPNRTENIWFARDVPLMAEALGTEPVLVVARRIQGDLQGIDPVPVAIAGIPNNHLEYAWTWFMLAVVWGGMTAYLISRIRRRSY
ncbi:SURF1 family protein [Paracoccus sp. S-4012]|uniref:SURF1 family protein n=1 Tax=Paracoccus sp. S-4012 TaxID=2665648 RepID=UPI0012AF529D|nr:SURF1 family protein [Paracoccus sp. S-4012]MRX49174.1 SURF1 family protein [Paracoccus sp. S-4012]